MNKQQLFYGPCSMTTRVSCYQKVCDMNVLQTPQHHVVDKPQVTASGTEAVQGLRIKQQTRA